MTYNYSNVTNLEITTFVFADQLSKRLSDKRLDFSNLMEQLSPAIKNSCRISQSDDSPKRITILSPTIRLISQSHTNKSTEDMMVDDITLEKENNVEELLKTPALGSSGTTAPRISFRKAQNTSDCSNGTDSPNSRKTMQRRNVENKKNDATDSPKAKASLTFGEISAKSFYGTSNVEPTTKRNSVQRIPFAIKTSKKRTTSVPSRRYHDRRQGARKPILGSIRRLNNKVKVMKVKKVDPLKQHNELLDRIEKVIETSCLKTYFKDLQPTNFDKDLISGRARNILKESIKSPNKSKASFPLDDVDNDGEKRFLSEDDDDQEEQENVQTNRKFFKSKSSRTKNRYQVAKGISATVTGQGIKLLSPPKKRQKIDDSYDELLSIRKEVQDIVKRLSSANPDADNISNVESEVMEMQNDDDKYDKYRKLIPYNTTDPNEIQRQETVLGILMENGICHDQNFKIFISEYEQNKDEAELILNNLFDISVSSDMNDQEQMWTSHEDEGTVLNENDLTHESNATNKEKREFHPIFYKDHRQGEAKKDILSVPLPKTVKWIPISDKQLQIDAGQKEFGSKNCNECSMFYTLHDPDDEMLHQKFHNNMMGVLNFKVSDVNYFSLVDVIIMLEMYKSFMCFAGHNKQHHILLNLFPSCAMYL